MKINSYKVFKLTYLVIINHWAPFSNSFKIIFQGHKCSDWSKNSMKLAFKTLNTVDIWCNFRVTFKLRSIQRICPKKGSFAMRRRHRCFLKNSHSPSNASLYTSKGLYFCIFNIYLSRWCTATATAPAIIPGY